MVDRRRCIAGRRCAYPGRMPVTVETTPPAEADEPAIPVEAGEQMPEEDGHFPGDPFFELGLALVYSVGSPFTVASQNSSDCDQCLRADTDCPSQSGRPAYQNLGARANVSPEGGDGEDAIL